MRKPHKLLHLLALLIPISVFGQTPTTVYDFSSVPITYTTSYLIGQSGTDPLSLSPNTATNGVEGTSGTSAGVSITGTSGLLLPANSSQSLSLRSTNGDRGHTLDLPSIPQTSASYMVQWSQWIRSTSAPRPIGILLGGGATTSTATASGQNIIGAVGVNTYDYVGIRPGYALYAVIAGSGTASAASITFYVYSVSVSGGNASFALLSTATATGLTITGTATGIIFRATAQNKTLKMEYALDGTGTTWATGVTYTNPSVSLNAGATQMLHGTPKAGASSYSFVDDVKYSALSTPPTVVFSGYNKYTYNGSPQGPTYTAEGFTGTATVTTTYQGKSVSGVTYSSSATAPTNPGSYVVSTSATDGINTVTDQKVFEILPSTIDLAYTFNSDVSGAVAANTTYINNSHTIVTQNGNQTINGTAYPLAGQMIKPVDALSITTLTNFGTATNYSVTWKEMPILTGQKRAIILRASGVSGTSTLIGQGYLFYLLNTTTTTTQIDIRRINASGGNTTLSSVTNVTYNGLNAPTWYRATVNGSTLKFEISTDGGITWTIATSVTDATYSSGSTQIAGINTGGSSYAIDYVGLTDLTKNVTVDDNKFVYTGSAVGPTVSYPGFTSPSTTLTYTGTGGTSYSASSTAPTAVGTYVLNVSASEGGVTRTGTFAFEIVPSDYDNLYTFKSDVAGNTPANIVYQQGATSGAGVVSMYAGTDNGSATTAITFKPTAFGSLNATGVADLTSIASSSNYSVTWKEYVSSTGGKKGFLLQGQTGTCAYATDLKQGYLFIVINDATNGTLLRIYKAEATGIPTYVVNANNSIANPAVGSARWYRATVAYGTQKFEYSDNGTTWVTGITRNDLTYAGLSGSTQAVYGIGNGTVGNYYYDYIASSTIGSSLSGGGNWSSATWTKTPTANSDVVITDGEVAIDANTAINSITLNPGAKLTLNSGKTLNLRAININSDANGTATFINNGTATITTSKVQQYLTNQSWYLTSPVSGTVTPTNLSRIQSYTEGSGDGTVWSATGTTMTAGKGYITSVSSAPNTVEFTGTINNGNISIPLTRFAASDANKYGFNLIGNPYTAYLDWKLVSAANSAKMPTSTMWYRTKVSGGWDFSTVNGAGETSPANVSDMIPPMQAFWVRASTVGNSTLNLTTGMIAHDNNSTNKLKAPAATQTERTKLRLQVSNGTNSDELLIYTEAKASNAFDWYDSPKISNENVDKPEISSVVGTESLVINGLNSLLLNTELPIRFMTKTANAFSLKANQVSNLPEGVKVILSDYGTEFDLTSGAEYNFTSDIADNTNRFSVIFRSTGAVTGLNKVQDNRLMVYTDNNGITLRANDEKLIGTEVSVYNAIGQKLISKYLNTSTMHIEYPFSPDVYLVKVNNITKKVIVK